MATVLTNGQTSFEFLQAVFSTFPAPCPHTAHLAGAPGAPVEPDLLIVIDPFGGPANLALLQTRIAPGVTRVAVLRDPAITAGIGQFAPVCGTAVWMP
jgi:hypothetical protein